MVAFTGYSGAEGEPMAAIVGYDMGVTLWVQCDRCSEQMMAFGEGAQGRPELEARIRAEGWRHDGGDGWLCSRCDSILTRSEYF
jgi:hypothetical protein